MDGPKVIIPYHMNLSDLDLPMEIMKLLEDDTVGTLHVKKIWFDPQAKLYIPSTYYENSNESLVPFSADWFVRAVLKISAIFAKVANCFIYIFDIFMVKGTQNDRFCTF